MYNLLNEAPPQDKIVYGLGQVLDHRVLYLFLQFSQLAYNLKEFSFQKYKPLEQDITQVWLRFWRGVEMSLKGSATDREILPSSNMPESMLIWKPQMFGWWAIELGTPFRY